MNNFNSDTSTTVTVPIEGTSTAPTSVNGDMRPLNRAERRAREKLIRRRMKKYRKDLAQIAEDAE